MIPTDRQAAGVSLSDVLDGLLGRRPSNKLVGMAFMRNKSRTSAQSGASSSHGWLKFAGRVAVPALGVGFAVWSAAVVTGLAAKSTSAPTPSVSALSIVAPAALKVADAAPSHASQKAARIHTSEDGKSDRAKAAAPIAAAQPKRHWSEIYAGKQSASFATDPARAARFALVTTHNRLTPAKLASIFGVAGTAVAVAAPTGKNTGPSTERFGIATIDPKAAVAHTVLAYADPSPSASSGALAALTAVSPQDEGLLSPDDEANDADGTAFSPDYEDTPEDTPLPLIRPRFEKAEKAIKAEEEAAPREVTKPKRDTSQQVAYARPNNPSDDRSGGGIGDTLKNLFNRPKVDNGVAVYDISAAKVYMPDGSVLEAHSGIGKMADNPKFVNVKMNGPTPPHTYNLKMREKRFHGVEAIRMLPVDGKNKHGRDGFLTHSYLLRGGRAESHGCVAFKDYNKFLNAFKQGKIRQLVVVPGGGRAIARNTQKGSDA